MTRSLVLVSMLCAAMLVASTASAATAPPAGWKKVGAATSSVVDNMSFCDANNGLAYSYDDGVLKTANGGASWKSVVGTLPPEFGVGDLAMASPAVAYAVGAKYVESSGTTPGGNVCAIYVTNDGGAHWSDRSADLGAGALFKVVAAGPKYAWAVGDHEQIYATSDGGVTWSRQTGTAENNGRFESVFFRDARRGWAAGAEFSPSYRGVVFRTTNGGRNWTRATVSVGTKLSAIGFSDATHGWTAGYEADKFYKTIDGGKTWKVMTFKFGGTPSAVHFATTSTGWFVCRGLWQTINGGKTWTQYLSKSFVFAFSMPSTTRAFAFVSAGGGTYQLYRWKK
jgi:photosystem II stability/assembly factor-like uncharacterized protein